MRRAGDRRENEVEALLPNEPEVTLGAIVHHDGWEIRFP